MFIDNFLSALKPSDIKSRVYTMLISKVSEVFSNSIIRGKCNKCLIRTLCLEKEKDNIGSVYQAHGLLYSYVSNIEVIQDLSAAH
jgi:hypothetical protein